MDWSRSLTRRSSFHPTGAGGTGRSYHGHEGLRASVEELKRGGLEHRVRILDVQEIDDGRVVVSCELLMGDTVVTRSTMIGIIAEGALVEVHGHLTEVSTLRQVRGIPGWLGLSGRLTAVCPSL